MLQGLDDGEVGVLRLNVLADEGNVQLTLVGAADDRRPGLPQSRALFDTGLGNVESVEVDGLAEPGDQTLLAQEEGNLVDGGHVTDHQNLGDVNLAEERDLADGGLHEGLFASAGNLEGLARQRFGGKRQSTISGTRP